MIGFSPCQDFKLTISLSGRGSHGVALGESSSLWLLKVKILRRKFFFVGKAMASTGGIVHAGGTGYHDAPAMSVTLKL